MKKNKYLKREKKMREKSAKREKARKKVLLSRGGRGVEYAKIITCKKKLFGKIKYLIFYYSLTNFWSIISSHKQLFTD